ncbi:MAG: transcription elongation factor GreA [candidate division NC10 bacterium]|nr:transcription elongation factor GreA [candidate division NC10 bacterium]
MSTVPISRAGYERLRKELDHFLRSERPKAIKSVEEARSHGDLTDNAEYQVARQHQALVEAKIGELQAILANCRMVDSPSCPPDKVVFGASVLIEDLETGERKRYELVGPYESDVGRGLISVTSPLGKGLIGRQEGDEVIIETPGGTRQMQIIEIGVRGIEGKSSA